MSQWVRLCSTSDIPAPEHVTACFAEGREICLANHAGTLSALDNRCPHRDGPLSEGWIEGDSVLCPWHAWGFNLHTGIVDPPEKGSVAVYKLREENGEVQIEIE